MKFLLTPFFALAAATGSVAQAVVFGAPAPNDIIIAGQNFTVEADFVNSLTGSIQSALVISIRQCFPSFCQSFDPPVLGNILYNGPYAFANHGTKFYENFTVTAPTTLEDGIASLFLTHFYLLGAGPEPILDVQNITVRTQAAP